MAGILTTREPRSPIPWFRRPLQSLRQEMEDFFPRFWGDNDFALTMEGLPRADVSETETAVEVRLDLPGVKPEEIDIQVSGNVLTVSGERKEEKEEKGKTFHRVERTWGSYSRSVMLPCGVNDAEAAAQYKDGVLTITLPKTEEAKTHKIKIKK
ncbi:MAG: Hsp20/alpha crystallin family protein [Planctomycetia bacterium]|nr:Hsp20/alpha crystallin family protein [Planctomycetia bacterium]